MKKLMRVKEAEEVCLIPSEWKFKVSTSTSGEWKRRRRVLRTDVVVKINVIL